MMISLIGIDVFEHGHESVSEYVACKLSNLSRSGCGTGTGCVSVPIAEYNVRILLDNTRSITYTRVATIPMLISCRVS